MTIPMVHHSLFTYIPSSNLPDEFNALVSNFSKLGLDERNIPSKIIVQGRTKEVEFSILSRTTMNDFYTYYTEASVNLLVKLCIRTYQ